MANLISEALIEAAGIVILVGIIVEGVKNLHPESEKLKRALPLLAMGIGIMLGMLYAVLRGDDVFFYAIAGLLAGGFSSGVYDVIEQQMKARKGGER